MNTDKKLTKASLAKSAKFDHKQHADRLADLNTQAQAARRIDVALGLYCFELKEIHLQYGQFGKWLAEHRPELARQHGSGNWQPSGSLDTAMWMAKSALEVCGYKIGDYIELVQNHFPCVHGKSDSAQLMLLPAAELPKEFKKLRDEIFDLVDGKSQRQLRAEFKQIENGKVKLGRVKGQGGASKEQRANAEELERQERITERTLKAQEIAEWLTEMSDDAGLGEIIGTEELAALDKAMETARGYIKHHGGGK